MRRSGTPGRRGTYLLTGLLKCLHCGGSLTMIDQRCYGCGTRNRGGDAACDNAIRIPRTHLENRFLAETRDQLLADDTIRWAEREITKQLAAPPIDTRELRKELQAVSADLERVVDAITKVGMSEALESKLADLEARKRSLEAELRAAERTVSLPDVSAITAKWRAIVEGLGNLPKRATPPEIETARKTLQSLFGIVRFDREGKGYADLAIGVPINMVAGAGFGWSMTLIELRRR